MSISSAELYAIYRAVSLIEEREIVNATILSESLSALQKLANPTNPTDDSLTVSTKFKLNNLKSIGYQINLWWIPSHTRMVGNDTADRLANEGRKKLDTIDIKLGYSEFVPDVKKRIWEQWVQTWSTNPQQKGKLYVESVKIPLHTTWFRDFSHLQRREISMLCRIRSGHCSIPAHLHRLHVKPDSLCECGSQGTLTHVLFECPINSPTSSRLYTSIQRISKTGPIGLADIIRHTPKLVASFTEFFAITVSYTHLTLPTTSRV